MGGCSVQFSRAIHGQRAGASPYACFVERALTPNVRLTLHSPPRRKLDGVVTPDAVRVASLLTAPAQWGLCFRCVASL